MCRLLNGVVNKRTCLNKEMTTNKHNMIDQACKKAKTNRGLIDQCVVLNLLQNLVDQMCLIFNTCIDRGYSGKDSRTQNLLAWNLEHEDSLLKFLLDWETISIEK